jgi:hypothetical protein
LSEFDGGEGQASGGAGGARQRWGAADSPGRGGEAPDRVRVLGFGVVTAGELWRAFLRYRGGQGVTGGPTTGGHPTVGRA